MDEILYRGAPSGALGMTNEEFEAVEPMALDEALAESAQWQFFAVPVPQLPDPDQMQTPAVTRSRLIDRIRGLVARWRR